MRGTYTGDIFFSRLRRHGIRKREKKSLTRKKDSNLPHTETIFPNLNPHQTQHPPKPIKYGNRPALRNTKKDWQGTGLLGGGKLRGGEEEKNGVIAENERGGGQGSKGTTAISREGGIKTRGFKKVNPEFERPGSLKSVSKYFGLKTPALLDP